MTYTILDIQENKVFVEELETQPENTERYIYTIVPYTIDYMKPRFNIETETWYESAETEEITAKQIEKETKLYEKRIQDGIKAIAQVSAENRIYRLSGAVSAERLNEIETLTEPVRREILAGQWVSAKRILEEIGIEALGEPPYVRYHTEITNYIAENYD